MKAFSSETTTRTLVALTILTWLLYRFSKRSRSRLPPGPRGIPFIGNAFQVDNSRPWNTFTKWKQLYGPLVYANMAGQPFIVLNSKKVVEDLLVHRAHKYSDRPRLLVCGEYMCRGLNFVIIHYNELWRKMRRASEAALGLKIATKYYSKQADESTLLAYGILKDCSAWRYHVHRATSSSILSIVYDLPSIQSPEHPTLAFMDEMISTTAVAVLPGAHLVDTFPILDYLPDFLARWRQKARADFQRWSATLEEMFLQIKNKSLSGMEQRPSFCLSLSETQPQLGHGMSDIECSWLAGALYGAGQETTTGVLQWFLFAMLLFPKVQQQAQEQLDAVVGQSRLPLLADMNQLPYIQAIVREILRWKSPVPTGIPHALAEDDYYEGYLIPKGSIVSVNAWSINHDPDIYGPDATHFCPERYLDENGNLKDPHNDGHFSYGSGYRICVGRHVANNFLFIAFATILWAMRIDPVKDSKGQPILPDPYCDTPLKGVTLRPPPFEFTTNPRFEDADTLLQHARDEIVRENEAHSSLL